MLPRLFLPKTLILDTNFVLGLKKTNHLGLLGKLRELVSKANLKILIPLGVYTEVKDADEHLAPPLTRFSKVVKVGRDKLFEELRWFATHNRYISADEYVDIEIMVLASKLKNGGEVGIVTFDEGIKRTIKNFPWLTGVEVVYPWKFVSRLIPFADPQTRDTTKKVVIDLCKYFYRHRVKCNRDVIDLVEDLVEDLTTTMELSGGILADLGGDLLLATDKYLNGNPLSPEEKTLLGDIIPLLDTIKLADSFEDVEKLEEVLIDTTSTLITLSKELVRGQTPQLLRLSCLLTSKSRFRLVSSYVDRGEIDKAIIHLDFLRFSHLSNSNDVNPQFLSKIHILMGLFHLLDGKHEQSIKYLDIAKKFAPLDLYGKITRLILRMVTNNTKTAENYLKKIEDEEVPIFGLLINFVHEFIIRKQYETAAKLLVLTKSCRDYNQNLVLEKVLILLKSCDELDLNTKKKLEELVSDDMLRDHTSKPLDKKLLGENLSADELHPTLKNKMIVTKHLSHDDKTFLVVWNQALKSMFGVIAPKNLENTILGAMSITVTGGTVNRVRRPSPQEKSRYGVRGILELSPNTQVEVEKWRIPIKGWTEEN